MEQVGKISLFGLYNDFKGSEFIGFCIVIPLPSCYNESILQRGMIS
nr:MAG TPA: hypothetical protein [Caudoviricetes sp.]